MQNDDPWRVGSASLFENREANTRDAPHPPRSLEEALLALDHQAAPVFAVLDGAQFDNLPRDLLMGDFVNRSLYLDRGDNNPEQVITAPHMVWLDERSEKITGRAPKDTIPALLNLIADRPAAVFWQCPTGADALYRHLRSINMVLYPKDALDDWVEPESEDADDDTQSKEKNTHTFVLFRHADANVIAQVLPAMDASESARFFGPATQLFCEAVPESSSHRNWLQSQRSEIHPIQHTGPLKLSIETVLGISKTSDHALISLIVSYLKDTDKKMASSYSDEGLSNIAVASVKSGQSIGFNEDFSYLFWSYLMMATGGRIADDEDILRSISVRKRNPDEQLEHYIDAFVRTYVPK